MTATALATSRKIVFELNARRVRVDEQTIDLTAYEAKLLIHLGNKPGQVVSFEELTHVLWGAEAVIETRNSCRSRTVDTHITRIRRKLRTLGVDPIANVRGDGYVWCGA